ncbi:hypothetical protein [Rhodanobacter fulvus]|uniref:hypothetical protein n=1 Tax=Rhodanobacter fulvus TaxID=219571 RepID=UPI0012EA7C0B|nr:hypothetical protein [Rhodanobacter fulvus]
MAPAHGQPARQSSFPRGAFQPSTSKSSWDGRNKAGALSAALRSSGKTVKRLARKHDVPIRTSSVKVVVKNQDTDEAIAKLGDAPVELYMPCFERTLAA